MARRHLVEQKQAATEARLASMSLPSGDGLEAARAEARARLLEMGLPDRRDEYWKFTRPEKLTQSDAPEAQPHAVDEAQIFDQVERLTLVFVDGVFDAAASDPLEGEGLSLTQLSQSDEKESWIKSLYGEIEAASQDPVSRPLAALNTAYASDGIALRVTQKLAKPVHLIYRHESASSDVMLHHLVRVESGAELTLLETGPAGARFNALLEVDVADEGRFHHLRLQGRDPERTEVTGIYGRLGRESVFKSFTLTFNGVLTRNEVMLTLTGDDAVAHVAGACLGDGDGFHHDDTVFITHDAVNCESRQVFKKVLRNGATGVFQGKILVKDGAQKTDGYQISQSLLLDGDSQFLAKPELEIYADDVACSHGSTSGAIDEEGLFYLRSRGVPEAEATNLLTLAFVAEAIEEIEDEDLAGELVERLSGWLVRHRG